MEGRANDVVTLPDDKIIVVGSMHNGADRDFAVAKYHRDGSLDTSFGIGGKVVVPIAGDAEARGVAVTPTGNIVVAGAATLDGNRDMVVVQLTASGALDTSFNGNGIQSYYSSSDEFGNAVAIRPDGRIVIAGALESPNGYLFALWYYRADGYYDTAGPTGFVTATSLGTSADIAHDVFIQADGKIVVAGTSGSWAAADFAVVRYNADNTLDTSFGAGGIRRIDFAGGADQAFAIAGDRLGGYVVAGEVTVGGATQIGLARLTSSGAMSQSFDLDGKVAAQMPGALSSRASDVFVLPDDRVMVVGRAMSGSYSEFAVARFLKDGQLDPTFAAGGTATVWPGGPEDSASAVAIQSNHAIVVAGAGGSGNSTFVVARLHQTNMAAGEQDYTFGAQGIVRTNWSIAAPDNEAARAVDARNGKIVAVGETYRDGRYQASIARYLPSGALDTSFSQDGLLIHDLGAAFATNSGALAVVIQPDDKILVGGYYERPENGKRAFVVWRYSSDGSLDESFGFGGLTYVWSAGWVNALHLYADGRILAVGAAEVNGANEFAVARLLANGRLDTTFDGDGMQTVNFYARTVFLEPRVGSRQCRGRSA
ncbi:MAG: hypothetical protein U0744_08620 [Gemmataceae bacterium]